MIKLKTIFIVLFLVLFCNISNAGGNNYFKVIKIVDGDTVYVDFNNNRIADFEERVRINGIDAFETKNNEKLEKQAKKYNLTEEEILGLGYLGKEFAKKELLNKKVKVEFSAETKTDKYNRPLVSIYYDCDKNCKSYEKEILKEGLATFYPYSNLKEELKPYQDIEKIKKNALKTNSMVILNLKNNKYHKLTCKYGQSAQNYVIINLNDLNKQAAKANCCYSENNVPIPIKKTPKLKDNGTIKVYYIRARDYLKPSYGTRTQAGKELIKLINNAQDTIDFAFYGLSHQDEIINALVNAQKRGVKVRGIVDININGKNDYSETLNNISKFKQNTIKSDYKTDIIKKEKIDNKQINYASNYKFKGHIMHNKFCIIDNKTVWSGTANISSGGTGGYNENVVLVINSKNLANIYTNEMNEMFDNENFHEDKKEIFTDYPLLIGNIETDVYFSPSAHAINEGIIPEIRKAKNYIYLSLFLLSRNDIAQELIKAKNRGVDVKLITESNHAIRKYSMHEYLRENNIQVKVENWGGKMHAKLAVIDDNVIIVGSTNWTKTGIMYNDENMLILRNATEQAKFLKNEFELSFKSIPDKWLYSNPQPEGEDSPGSCFDGLDNNYNGLIDSEDPACFGVDY